jgi:hypothetical protein
MRNKAVDGDVIFLTVNRNDILSRVTSWFTKSPYTHAAFVFWYKSRLMVVESTTHGGIRIVQASTYKDRNIEILSPKIHWMDIEESAISKSGTAEYGWVSAMYIGLREFLFKYFEIKLPVNKNNRNKACSEFVAEVLNLEDTDITPRKLYEILEQSK